MVHTTVVGREAVVTPRYSFWDAYSFWFLDGRPVDSGVTACGTLVWVVVLVALGLFAALTKKAAFLAVAAVVALVPFVFMVATYLYVLLYILFALLSR